MKKLVIFLLLYSISSKAQYTDKQWCFGDSVGIDFSNPAAPQFYRTKLKSLINNASLSDSTGALMYYIGDSSGAYLNSDYTKNIFSKNNNLIQNGDSIIGSIIYPKAFVSLPFSKNSNSFVVFSSNFGSVNDGLYYSVFNMDADFTNGNVTVKNQQLLNFECSGLAAVKHGNGRDWWLVTKSYSILSDTFYTFLITPNSIQGPYKQKIGASLAYTPNAPYLFFNNQGNALVYVTSSGLIEKYNFDRCTGLLSNKITISTEKPLPIYPAYQYGCFSPNDSLLYITNIINSTSIPFTGNNLYQVNLYAPVMSLDSLYQFPYSTFVGNLKVAPDNKIYIASGYTNGYGFYKDTDYNQYNMNLSVINSPNLLGQACNLQPFSFYLGGARTYFDLPNNTNYELGALAGSTCDTLSTGINDLEIKNTAELFIFYHHAWQKAFINAQNIKGRNCLLTIYDIRGMLVFSSQTKTQPPYFTHDVDCTNFPTGLYVVNLSTEKENLSTKFIKK